MTDRTAKPTTRSEQHLDRVDRMIAEHRGDVFDDPEEITSRQQVEEIARLAAEDVVRARPTPVHITLAERYSSMPPSKRRGAKLGALGGVLAGIAAVLVALSQCTHDVRDLRPAHQAK